MNILFVLLISTGAGLIQTLTGFGAVVFQMLFFPYLFSMAEAPALATASCLVFCISMAWQYRKHFTAKTAVYPTAVYSIVSTFAIYYASSADLVFLKKCFAVFLILLSVYLFFFSAKLKVSRGWLTATVCSSISGLSAGLFGIGGPPMAMFFLSVTDSWEEYTADLQFMFAVTGAINCITRASTGVFTPTLILLSLIGTCGMLIGKKMGVRIIGKADRELIKKLVYGYVCISGILMLI